MIVLRCIPDAVEAALQAATFFASLQSSIIKDDGTKDDAINSALRSNGLAVVIGPILEALPNEPDGQIPVLIAKVLVSLEINPATGPSPYPSIQAIIRSVLDWTPAAAGTPGDTPFMLSGEGCTLTAFDPGLFSYNLVFTKHCLVDEEEEA